ncbi:MAG: cation:dicarboxylase symporter family transporter [Cyclobacteriaceae bacterium]
MLRFNTNSWLTIGSLSALALAALIGALVDADQISWWLLLSEVMGKLWVILLLLLVIPLVCTYVFHTIMTMGQSRPMARLGFHAIKAHVLILVSSVAFTIIVGQMLLWSFNSSLSQLHIMTDAKQLPNQEVVGSGVLSIVLNMLDIGQKYLGQGVLLLMFMVLLVGLAGSYWQITFLKSSVSMSEQVGHRAMSWLKTYFITLPFAVFVLILPLIVESGMAVIGVALYFVLILCFLLFAFTAVLYVITYFGAGTGLVEFGRGIFHAQLTALSTRSSMATIPAMILASKKSFDIPENVAAMAIPFFTTIFRLNKGISSIFKFLFLSYVYGIPIEPATLLMFASAQILVSFGTPGIPSGSKFITLPIYLAAGIPMEGYVLLKAVDAIPDIFKTVLNITEVMTIVLIVKDKLKALA